MSLKNVFRPTPEAWIHHPVPQGYSGSYCRASDFAFADLGFSVEELEPGQRGGPLHYHLFEEEIFFVQAGTLTVRELEPDAEAYREFELRAGELIVYPAGTRLAHQSFNRGTDKASYFLLSDDQPGEVCVYPDSGKTMLRALKGVGVFGEDGSPAPDVVVGAANEAARSRPVHTLALHERPPHVIDPGRLPERDLGGPFGRQLSREGGARRVFVNLDRLPPGTRTGPLHCHTAEEEALLVVSGTPTVVQLRGKGPSTTPFEGAERERMELQARDMVHWAAGDFVAHQVVNGSDRDAVLLVIGTDRPDDLVLFPEDGTLVCKALGARGRLEVTPYWHGEGG